MKKEVTVADFEKYLDKVRKKSGDHLLGSTIETYVRLVADIFEGDTLRLPFKELVAFMNKDIKRYQNPVLMSGYRQVLKYLGYDEADAKKLKVEFNLAVASRSKRFLQSKVLSKKEVLRFIDGVFTTQGKLIISMLYDTACRRDELLNIKMSDINFKECSVSIMGKGNIRREVYYTKSTEKLLIKQVAERKLTKDSDERIFIFYDKTGEPVKNQDNALWRWFRDQSALIIGRHLHPHMLRHTCLTHMADNGADILDIKAYAGHSDIKTSMIYVEVSSFRRKSAFNKYKVDLETIRKEL